MNKVDQCHECHEGYYHNIKQNVKFSLRVENRYFYFLNLPVIVCDKCGDMYFLGSVSKIISHVRLTLNKYLKNNPTNRSKIIIPYDNYEAWLPSSGGVSKVNKEFRTYSRSTKNHFDKRDLSKYKNFYSVEKERTSIKENTSNFIYHCNNNHHKLAEYERNCVSI